MMTYDFADLKPFDWQAPLPPEPPRITTTESRARTDIACKWLKIGEQIGAQTERQRYVTSTIAAALVTPPPLRPAPWMLAPIDHPEMRAEQVAIVCRDYRARTGHWPSPREVRAALPHIPRASAWRYQQAAQAA